MINDSVHLAEVAAFVAAEDLTARIARLESSLIGADSGAAAVRAADAGFTPALLQAARRTRAELGRIDDLIHATAISLLLPALLEPGERVEKLPSLASGNDPGRQFDLETTGAIGCWPMARRTCPAGCRHDSADPLRQRARYGRPLGRPRR